MNKYIVCTIIALTVTVKMHSQDIPDSVHMFENRLIRLFDKLYTEKDETSQDAYSDSITQLISQTVRLKDHFLYPFDTLRRMGKISSDDKQVRIFTWNVPLDFGRSRYYGLIARYNRKNKDISFFPLKNYPGDIENENTRILDTEHWPGALYYEIIDFKSEGKTSYVLLGFNLGDILTNKKYIDILDFEETGSPRFGKNIFVAEGKKQTRMIFTYSEKTAMSLTYNKHLKMIIFDHLSPDRPSLTGQYQFYGPDLSFDGLKFEDNSWGLIKDIEVTN